MPKTMENEFDIAMMIGVADPDNQKVMEKHRSELDAGARNFRSTSAFLREEINAYIIRHKDYRTGQIHVLKDPTSDAFKVLRRWYS